MGPTKKSWFILDDVNKALFSKLILSDKEKYNCTELLHPVFLVKSKEPCWRCAGISDVYCLAASGFINSDFEHDELSTYSNIKVLSENLVRVLKMHAPKYNQDYSQKAGSVYYMNHCQYCNAKLGDFICTMSLVGHSSLSPQLKGKALRYLKLRILMMSAILMVTRVLDPLVTSSPMHKEYKYNSL